ncbi:hypothetical protein M9Y10_020383 [Tritrichomonas musculus]|uniref:Uncharacterized protein n=1 Tax=Tritrichomonas musculus TaxID=1915356 RepID=A0ABR2HH72_9EUKA
MIYLFILSIKRLTSAFQFDNKDDKTDQQKKSKLNRLMIGILIGSYIIASIAVLIGLIYFSFEKKEIHQHHNVFDANKEIFNLVSCRLPTISR